MAVIKQQRQFFTQNIGVVRSTRAAEQSAVNTMNNADTLIGMAFKHASDDARIKGQEVAQSLSDSNITTIDPTTGQPQALSSMPKTFGRIATQAYQSVVDDRYRISIDNEINLKASEIALEAQQKSDPVSYYSTEMGDYIDTMRKNTSGKYQSYIDTVGTNWLASTKLNLQEKVIQKDRELAKTEIISELEKNIPLITNMVVSGRSDLEFQTAYSIENKRINDAYNSNTFNAEERDKALNALNSIKPVALTKIITNDEEINNSDLLKIKQVINNNGLGLSSVPEQYREQTKQLIDSMDFSVNKTDVLDELTNSVALKNQQRIQEKEALSEKAQQEFPKIQKDIIDKADTQYSIGINAGQNGSEQEINALVFESEKTLDELMQQTVGAGASITTSLANLQHDSLTEGIRKGILIKINKLEGIDSTQLNLAAEYIANLGEVVPDGLNENSKQIMDELLNSSAFNVKDNLDEAIQFLTQSETSRNQDEIKTKSASADDDTYNATLDKANFYKTQSELSEDLAERLVEGDPKDFDTTFDELLQVSKKTVTDAIEKKFTGSMANEFSEELQSNVLNAWSYNLPNDDITYTIDNESVEMDSTIINVIKKSIMSQDNMAGVPDELKPQIERIRELPISVRKKVNTSLASVRANLVSIETAKTKSQKAQTIIHDVKHQVNSDTDEHKDRVNQLVYGSIGLNNLAHRQQAGGDLGKNLIDVAVSTNRLPDQLISDLELMSTGVITQYSPVLLSHYQSLRDYIRPETGEKQNLFISSGLSIQLDASEQAKLDTVLANMSVKGFITTDSEGKPQYNVSALNQELTTINQISRDKNQTNINMENFANQLDSRKYKGKESTKIRDFVQDLLNNNATLITEIGPYLQQRIKLGSSPKQIQNDVDTIMQKNYSDTEGYVIDSSIASVTRSKFALSRVTSSEQEKMEFLQGVEERLPDRLTIMNNGQKSLLNLFGQGDRTKDSESAFLMPVPFTNPNNPIYQVMEIKNGRLTPVIENGSFILEQLREN